MAVSPMSHNVQHQTCERAKDPDNTLQELCLPTRSRWLSEPTRREVSRNPALECCHCCPSKKGIKGDVHQCFIFQLCAGHQWVWKHCPLESIGFWDRLHNFCGWNVCIWIAIIFVVSRWRSSCKCQRWYFAWGSDVRCRIMMFFFSPIAVLQFFLSASSKAKSTCCTSTKWQGNKWRTWLSN